MRGHCLCGAVVFEVDGDDIAAIAMAGAADECAGDAADERAFRS